MKLRTTSSNRAGGVGAPADPNPPKTQEIRAKGHVPATLPKMSLCKRVVLPRLGPVAAAAVTPGITARNAAAPPIHAAEPLFLTPAVNFCTV